MWLLLIIIKMFVHLYFWKKFPLFRFSVHAVLTRTPPPLFSHWPATELARSRNRSQGHDVGHCSFFFPESGFVTLSLSKIVFSVLTFHLGSWAGQPTFVTWPNAALKSLMECTCKCTSQLQQFCIHKGTNWNFMQSNNLLSISFSSLETLKLLPR